MSDAVTQKDASHTVRVIEERLAPSIDDESLVARTATLIYELILLVIGQGRAQGRIKHHIEHVRGAQTLMLDIKGLNTLDWPTVEAMQRAAAGSLLDLSFCFASPETLEPLTSGRISLALHIGTDTRALPLAVYLEPERSARRAQTQLIDWRASCVSETADQTLLLELVGDVFHMHTTMPAQMQVSLEPVHAVDYSAKRAGKRTRDDATSSGEDRQVLGYALHFAGVPSFSHCFLEHLAQKYRSRWIGAMVIFPHQRRAMRDDARTETHLVAPELIISLAKAAKDQPLATRFATRGARQLCKKICS